MINLECMCIAVAQISPRILIIVCIENNEKETVYHCVYGMFAQCGLSLGNHNITARDQRNWGMFFHIQVVACIYAHATLLKYLSFSEFHR